MESALPLKPASEETERGPDRLGALLDAIATDGLEAKSGTAREFANLQAGRDALNARRGETQPDWYDPESDGLALAGANLAGATLSRAVLEGANLRGANVSKAVAHAVDFSHAILEQANFAGADLGGARFHAVKGGEASFPGAMLEDAHFEHASLRFACFEDTLLDGANFTHADLWGASFKGTDADEASFRRARLDEANLTRSNFAEADFSDASLKKVNLTEARLQATNLIGAHLEGANLTRADLSHASLARLNLLSCDLTHVRLAGAWLELTRLQASQLGGAVGEELAGEFDHARQAYIALEQNFRTLGASDDTSWAFRKRRKMGKLHARALAWQTLRARDLVGAVRHGFYWLADAFVEWLCDYGESLGRVLRAFVCTVLFFAIVYGLAGALTRIGPAGTRVATRDPLDLLAYSLLDMLSTSLPDIGIKPLNELVIIVSSMQSALGIVLIGLFGFVLGNRMRR